jgi:hypothetical protein
VRLWLYSAGSFLARQDKDRTGIREIVRQYEYYLYGKQDGNGNLVVNSGAWVKGDLVDSRRDHSDFIYMLSDPARLKHASRNPEIDGDFVDKIIGR